MEDELTLLRNIAEKRNNPSKWTNSTFEIIKQMTTSDKGEIGEEFIYVMCVSLVDKGAKRNPHSRDAYDIKVLGKTIEVKTATEDTHNKFQFNGIRYQRIYDFLLVLGIAPNNVYFNIYTSADVKTQKIGVLVPMEKGTVGSHKLTRGIPQLFDIPQFKQVITKVLQDRQGNNNE